VLAVHRGAVLSILLVSTVARADRVVGPRVRGHSKVTERTALRLSHVAIGDEVEPRELPRIQEALLSSELFESVGVALEPAAGGVVVVATADDKHSWVAAPMVYVLPGNFAVGAGFAENDLRGEEHNIFLYGQIGTRDTFFSGTFLVPQVADTHRFMRFDVLPSHRVTDEYEGRSLEAYFELGLTDF